jgi:hypothetical protein
MEMVLTLICISIVLTVVSAVLLAAAIRLGDAAQPVPEKRQAAEGPRFFQSDIPRPVPGAASPVPTELLLRQIERHVRLERAAAESFHLCPTPESLHVHTTVPLEH